MPNIEHMKHETKIELQRRLVRKWQTDPVCRRVTLSTLSILAEVAALEITRSIQDITLAQVRGDLKGVRK